MRVLCTTDSFANGGGSWPRPSYCMALRPQFHLVRGGHAGAGVVARTGVPRTGTPLAQASCGWIVWIARG